MMSNSTVKIITLFVFIFTYFHMYQASPSPTGMLHPRFFSNKGNVINRISRTPQVTPEEIQMDGKEKFFRSPSVRHKLLAKGMQLQLAPSGFIPDASSISKLISDHDNIFKNDPTHSSSNSGEIVNTQAFGFGPDYQQETAPYISSRVLNNLPAFFDHLRSSLASLQTKQNPIQDDDIDLTPSDIKGNAKVRSVGVGDNHQRWIPPNLGLRGRKGHVRHFVNPRNELEAYLKQAYSSGHDRNYEFGLG